VSAVNVWISARFGELRGDYMPAKKKVTKTRSRVKPRPKKIAKKKNKVKRKKVVRTVEPIAWQ
jgi:hypothetical protein